MRAQSNVRVVPIPKIGLPDLCIESGPIFCARMSKFFSLLVDTNHSFILDLKSHIPRQWPGPDSVRMRATLAAHGLETRILIPVIPGEWDAVEVDRQA